jgi:hypothetical protein
VIELVVREALNSNLHAIAAGHNRVVEPDGRLDETNLHASEVIP